MPTDLTRAWVSATLPKAGHSPDENEDAVAADAARLRFALADGATEGWQSGGWAARLASCFVRRPPTPADFPAWLTAVRGWSPPATPADAPWYAEVKREQGSFATLVGVELRRPREGAGLLWRAVAVGDSCLLVVRGNRVETAFPLSTPDAFGTRPALIPSTSAACPDPEWLAGRAEPGDLLLLASDALARHLLSLSDAAAWEPVLKSVSAALDANSPDPLLELLTPLRDELNDDATAVALRVPAEGGA